MEFTNLSKIKMRVLELYGTLFDLTVLPATEAQRSMAEKIAKFQVRFTKSSTWTY